MTIIRILFLLALPILAGCSSKLIASREDGTKVPGIPIGTPELVKITSTTSYKPVKSGVFEDYCTPEVNSSIQFLPLGEVTYLNMDPSAIAKGEFTLEFSDSGNIKKVSLNSDASSGIDSVNTLASTLLPFLAAPKIAETPSTDPPIDNLSALSSSEKLTAKELKEKHCLKVGTTVDNVSATKVIR